MRIRNAARFTSPRNVSLIGDDRGKWRDTKTRKGHGEGLLARMAKAALAVILVAGLLPLVPGASVVEEAEALEGTTNYADFFTIGHRGGAPGVINGNTLRGASSQNRSDYEYRDDRWMSSSVFISKRPVSLLHDWEVCLRANLAEPALANAGSTTSSMVSNLQMGLSSISDPAKTEGLAGIVVRNWARGSGRNAQTKISTMTGGVASGIIAGPASITSLDSYDVVLRFTAATREIAFSAGGQTFTHKVKASLGSDPYLFLQETIAWWNGSTTNPDAPQDLTSTMMFQSLSLPHLEPAIENVGLYRENGAAIGKDDIVAPGEKVQVRCTVRNSYAYPGSEQYPMHVKLANTASYPTRGLSAFYDSSHPLQVNGTTVATAFGPDTVTGANGVPITLAGSNSTTVSYWATITGVSGGPVTLSQELIEDTFQGRKYATVELVAEQSLRPPANPDDPDSWGEAGKDYHYTRLPQPNENGWNTTPVSVQFFAGDFNQLALTPANGDAAVTLSDQQAWTRSDDTDGYGVEIRATNTATGEVSSKKTGTIKIDTSAPRLSLDPALGALTVDDRSSDASKATSGVWRLHRTGADGSPAAGRASAREFPLTNGAGAATQTVANIANGYYVAEDAAGNLSAPLKVSTTEPPSVERPAGSIANPSDPGYTPPVGPELGPGSDPVPTPTVTEDGEGLKHAVIEESVSEMIDPAAPPFGGALDAAKAKAMMDYRYAATSAAGVASISDELLDASGNAVASFDTKVPGECLVRRTVTDDQGNTTTILLHYSTIRDNCPLVRPIVPVDPDDPDGPKEPGDPISPSGPVTTDPDGSQHATVDCEVTEATGPGTMDRAGALALLERHFDVATLDDARAHLTVQSMKELAGSDASSIDLSRPADYLITYLAADDEGNTTMIRLTYHLVKSKAPEVKPRPTPTDPDPAPLEPGDPPHIHPDGTHHAVMSDKLRVPARAGEALSLQAARELMEGRYTFTALGGGATTERSLTMATANGNPVGSIDLSKPGVYLISYTRADADGNTATVNLTYEVFRDECPVIRPIEPTDPADPTGSKQPGEPIEPSGPVVEGPDGTQSTEVECEVTEAVCHGTMDSSGAEALLRRHFLPTDVDGGDGVTVAVQSMKNSAGNQLSAIDTSRVADYLITYVVRDAAGNTTTVRLTYHLVSSHVPGVIVTPDPGTDPNPRPGDDPLNPRPRPVDPACPPEVAPDGTQHAVVEDEMRVPAEAGASLSLADARSLVQRRYTFTPEGGGAVAELSLALADAAGGPVSSIDRSRPGSWLVTYKVADQNGNTVTVRLRYLVVSDAPEVTPRPGDGQDGSDPNPGGGGGSGGGSADRDPLPPTITVDPETGLTHAIVTDHVIVGTSDTPMTSQAMVSFIDARYRIAASMGGTVQASPVLMADAAGAPVDAIDRSNPGVWNAEQVFSDEFGDTTTLKLTYEVRANAAGGSMGGSGSGGSTDTGSGDAGDGSNAGSGKGAGSSWSSHIRALPQTGGIFACPLHILFVLMMLLVSAYTMMRLRQEGGADRREERRREAV